MSKVIFDMSMSLDGFVRASKYGPGKDVAVMGGPDVGRQFLRAGLVDEIGIHLVPVLFGSGLRMFDHLGEEHITLEVIETIPDPGGDPSAVPRREVVKSSLIWQGG